MLGNDSGLQGTQSPGPQDRKDPGPVTSPLTSVPHTAGAVEGHGPSIPSLPSRALQQGFSKGLTIYNRSQRTFIQHQGQLQGSMTGRDMQDPSLQVCFRPVDRDVSV